LNLTLSPRRRLLAAASATLLQTCPVGAAAADPLVDLINAYRAAPAACEGTLVQPLPALRNDPGLARVKLGTGIILEPALERAGYAIAQADAIHVAGAQEAPDVMATIATTYCRSLLNAKFTQVGVRRNGDSWLIVLAQPAPPPRVLDLPDQAAAGKLLLAAVNAARALPRSCGAQAFEAALPLDWNGTLAAAALAHSRDMAQQSYFDHKGKDGSMVTDRARAAGYRWRRIAENIAAGQESAAEVVDGWLASPGHCSNIMNPAFSEMGAAYAIGTGKKTRVYWTQVLGDPP
jgi:uncharacterized protein YkwD